MNEENRHDGTLASQDLRRQKEMERKNLRDALHQQKYQDMLEIRRQREINERRKKDLVDKSKFVNQIKSKEVKAQEEIGLIKKKEYHIQQLRLNKIYYDKRMEREEKVKIEKEMEVLNMEQLEMELIRKLQQTQMLQKDAYEELETALANPPEEYAKRYNVGNTHSQNAFKLAGLSPSRDGLMVNEDRLSQSDFGQMREKEFSQYSKLSKSISSKKSELTHQEEQDDGDYERSKKSSELDEN